MNTNTNININVNNLVIKQDVPFYYTVLLRDKMNHKKFEVLLNTDVLEWARECMEFYKGSFIRYNAEMIKMENVIRNAPWNKNPIIMNHLIPEDKSKFLYYNGDLDTISGITMECSNYIALGKSFKTFSYSRLNIASGKIE